MESISVTPSAISTLLSNPNPDVAVSAIPDLVVQVVDLKPVGNSNTRFTFMANDGKDKIKAMLPTTMSSEVSSGSLQNLGLIRILDYTCNSIVNQPQKVLIVTKCEVVSPSLEKEVKLEKETGILLKPKLESETGLGIILKPKNENNAKSAAQIFREHQNSAPSARMAMTRRVHPLVSLNPYQGNWTIKVRVTSKGSMRSYKNARGEGNVCSLEFTDEDSTQIQATMFNETAKKFYEKLELGKVYYISRGTLKLANRKFSTVPNDYEMTLNESSEVEEVCGEQTSIPEMKFNFVKIDQLGPYVNGKDLVDIVGVVQHVSHALSIRRKSNNEDVPKREITVADESKRTVTVSLWNELATKLGQELLDQVDSSPVVAIRSLRVGDFQGVSLSTISKSSLVINPDIPEAKTLRSWYDSEGKGTTMASAGSAMTNSKTSSRSMYSDRISISHITDDPSLGQDKPAWFSTKAYINFIKPDQTMWYRACKACNKKVSDAIGSGYWCEGCQKNDVETCLRYILVVKAADSRGEAWLSLFNDQAEQVLNCSADELDAIKSEDEKKFQFKLKEAMWVPHLFRVSVAQSEYMNEKRQRITARTVAPIDWAAETKYLLEELSKLKAW